MRKGIFLLVISCLVLTSCSNAISLADNFAEDENYYDPTLPSPQFARTSLSLPHVYTEEDMDGFWTDTSETSTRPSDNSNSTGLYGSPGSNWGIGNNTHFGGPFSFFGGYGPMFNPWSSGNNPYWLSNYGWGIGNSWGYNNGWNSYHTSWNNGWGYGIYDPYSYGWNPYGNSWGWNNGWGNNNGWTNTGTSGSGSGTTNSSIKTIYSGSRPTKYQSFHGSGSSSGRTLGGSSSNTSGWRGIIESATSLQETQAQKNVRSSYPRSNGASSYTTKRHQSSKQNSARMYNDNNRSRSYQSSPERTNNSSRSYSPSPSRNTRTSNSNSSNSRRR